MLQRATIIKRSFNWLLYATLLLLYAVPPVIVSGQASTYTFEKLSTRDGSFNDRMLSICKDRSGFMWFGTASGLNRYDGYNFKIFRHRAGDTTSISDNFVRRVCEGPGNTIWASTQTGWNIYDPLTEKFSTRIGDFLEKIGIPNRNISGISIDPNGDYWFVIPGEGLYKYNSSAHSAIFYNAAGNRLQLYSYDIESIAFDTAGMLWIVYTDGIIEKVNLNNNRVQLRSNALQNICQKKGLKYRLCPDADNDLWIYATNEINGLYWYHAATGKLQIINKDTDGMRLNNNTVNGVVQDNKGLIWVATDHGGINIINKQKKSVDYLLHDDMNTGSISDNAINTIYRDSTGIVWIGTSHAGVNYYYGDDTKFPLYRRSNKDHLPYNDVNCFAEDNNGDLWIGSNGGGLIHFNRATGTYRQWLCQPGVPGTLSSNIITSLCLDRSGILWIGTYLGGLNRFDGKTFTCYRHDNNDPVSLADNNIWKILEDSRGRIWIGTLSKGLQLFDRKTKKFIAQKEGSLLDLVAISALMEDSKGNIWVGSGNGIDIIGKDGRFLKHLNHQDKSATTLSQNNVMDIAGDSSGLIWIATRGGLCMYEPGEMSFKKTGTEIGLPGKTILRVLIDRYQNLWLTTPDGLYQVTVNRGAGHSVTLTCKNYDETNGLQGSFFNDAAAYAARSGEIIAGGPNGFNIFFPPKAVVTQTLPPKFTVLKVLNNDSRGGTENDDQPGLVLPLLNSKQIELGYNQIFLPLNLLHLLIISTGLK